MTTEPRFRKNNDKEVQKTKLILMTQDIIIKTKLSFSYNDDQEGWNIGMRRDDKKITAETINKLVFICVEMSFF